MRSLATIVISLMTMTSAAVELEGPEVIKTGWSTGSLVAADIDGDGRNDLAIINNDRARVELLIQREPGSKATRTRPTGLDRWQPILEDSRFDRRGVPTGSRMFALAAGDLDGDGFLDLAFTGTPDGLTVLYQDKDGNFDRQRVFDISEPAGLRGTVVMDDFDADGRTDLAVLTKTELLLYRQTADGEIDTASSFRLSGASYALEIVDVDGDERVDVTYQVSGTADSLRVRHGLADGGFGPELAYRMSESRGVVRTLPSSRGAGSDFVHIQEDTGLIERLAFKPPERGKSPLSNARPRVFAFATDGKAPTSSALGDFDGNGFLDLAVADSRGARIWLLRQKASGVFADAEEFPSLSGIRALVSADVDNDGRDDLIMASPKERTLAWTRLADDDTLELPSVIDTEGKPEALAAADFDHDGHLDLVYASVEKRDRRLYLIPGASGWDETVEIELTELETDPLALRVVDLDADDRLDLVLFVNHDPIRLLVQNDDGGFEEIEDPRGFGRSLVTDVDPSAFTLGDVEGDGNREIIIASSGFARAIRLDEAQNLEVVAQFNARSSDTEIAAASILGESGSDHRVVALLEPVNDRLHILAPRRGGVWRFLESIDLPSLDLVEARSVDLDGSGTHDLAIFGSDRFVWLPVGVDDEALRPVSSWECDLEGVNYRLLGVGDLDADGSPEVVAVDTRDSHVLEVFRPADDGEWTSLLHFTVFEVDSHYEGQRGAVNQPREIVIADLTDDGLDDLALVVHDRILLYPQSK